MFLFVFMCFILFMDKQLAANPLYDAVAHYEYMEDAKLWLRLRIEPTTWQEARLRCHLEGAVLAVPTNESLLAEMAGMMKDAKRKQVFVGAHALATKGDFVTINGTPFEKTGLHWAPEQPDNENNAEWCVAMDDQNRVSDESCERVLPYFCVRQNITLNKCNSTDDGYKYEPRTGSCYRFHRVARTWHRAAMACSATSGHLAIINSKVEADVIKKLFEQFLPNDIIGAHNINYASIGIWTMDDEDGEWFTIHGQKLSEAGYEKWKKGEPNNYRHAKEFCGSVSRGGTLNDVPCNFMRYPFICEIFHNTVIIEEESPGTTEENKPGPSEENNPGLSEGNKPGSSKGNNPWSSENNRPGSSKGNNPWSSENNRPGSSGNNPWSSENNKPGSSKGNNPWSSENNRPGSSKGNNPWSSEKKKPGSSKGNKPGSSKGNKPGSSEKNKPEESDNEGGNHE